MMGDITTFNKYGPCNKGIVVRIVDGSFSTKADISSVIMSQDKRLGSIYLFLNWIIIFYLTVRRLELHY